MSIKPHVVVSRPAVLDPNFDFIRHDTCRTASKPHRQEIVAAAVLLLGAFKLPAARLCSARLALHTNASFACWCFHPLARTNDGCKREDTRQKHHICNNIGTCTKEQDT